MNKEINPQCWFGNREIKNMIPIHFVKSSTPVSDESYQWVVRKLSGRFGKTYDFNDIWVDSNSYLFFEDPKEAMIYELRWSGSN